MEKEANEAEERRGGGEAKATEWNGMEGKKGNTGKGTDDKK